MNALVTYRRKVRYSDTDLQGIVFNGNYFVYFDDAMTDLFEVLGMTPDVMNEHGFDVVTAHVGIDFLSSARLGDVVATNVSLDRIGTTSITCAIESVIEGTDRVVVRGKLVWVTVEAETFAKTRVPAVLRSAFEMANRAAAPD